MLKFETLKGQCVPVNIKDVDTDMIIPAQYLTSTSKEGYGENLFQRLRDQDEDFPLNQDKHKGANILIADDNFGCGSSREHAVWALQGWGFRVVLAKSFADIFFANSAKNGLLLISLSEEVIEDLLSKAEDSLELEVNLEEQTVSDGSSTWNFDYDPFRRFCLLQGLDDIDYIFDNKSEIDKFRNNQKRFYKTTDV